MYDYDYDHIFNTSVLLNTSIPTACFWNVGSEHTKLAKVEPHMTKKIKIISKCFGLLYHHHHYHFFVVSSSKCTNRAIASWLVGRSAEYTCLYYIINTYTTFYTATTITSTAISTAHYAQSQEDINLCYTKPNDVAV